MGCGSHAALLPFFLCRFLTLVDVMYEHNIRLFCSAAGSPFELFEHIVSHQGQQQQQQQPAPKSTSEVLSHVPS